MRPTRIATFLITRQHEWRRLAAWCDLVQRLPDKTLRVVRRHVRHGQHEFNEHARRAHVAPKGQEILSPSAFGFIASGKSFCT